MKFLTTTLESERLVLRKPETRDSNALFSIFSNQQTMKYWGHAAYTKKQQATDHIHKHIECWDTGKSLCMTIETKANPGLIGTISLFNIHEESRRAEVGYILSNNHWGCGLMSEALVAMLDYAFFELKLNRLEADIDPDNVASASLLKRMGFQLEGVLKERWIIGDLITDTELYGLLSKNYLNNWSKTQWI